METEVRGDIAKTQQEAGLHCTTVAMHNDAPQLEVLKKRDPSRTFLGTMQHVDHLRITCGSRGCSWDVLEIVGMCYVPVFVLRPGKKVIHMGGRFARVEPVLG